MSSVISCYQKAPLCWEKTEALAHDGTWNENKLPGQVNGRRLSILTNYFCPSLSLRYGAPPQALHNSHNPYWFKRGLGLPESPAHKHQKCLLIQQEASSPVLLSAGNSEEEVVALRWQMEWVWVTPHPIQTSSWHLACGDARCIMVESTGFGARLPGQAAQRLCLSVSHL